MLRAQAQIVATLPDLQSLANLHCLKSLGRTLHHLFREALAAGKAARAQTSIGGESVSIATAAVEAAKSRLGTLEAKSILVVGAGKMGRTAVRRLRAEGAARVVVVNRTASRSLDLVDEAGFGEVVELPDLIEALVMADVVVASTGAANFVIDAQRLAAAMERRPERPLFIVDIAVPRGGDTHDAAEAKQERFVKEDQKSGGVEGREKRREAIPHVEEIIAEYVERFDNWYRSRVAVPVISRLTQKAEAIRAAELERLLARCPDIGERERMLVTGMTLTIVSKLLHSVILKIREKATLDRSEALSHARVLDELFELEALADGER